MIKDQISICPECNTSVTIKGGLSTLLVCARCGTIIENGTGKILEKRRVAEDWSLIQIGTTGKWNGKSFEVIGRIHLHLRAHYKNFWYVWIDVDRSYGWLIESFGQFSFCHFDFWDSPSEIRFRIDNISLVIDKDRFTTNSVNKCELVTYEGEIFKWPSYSDDFNLIEGTGEGTLCGYFLQLPSGTKILTGDMANFSNFEFQNLRKEFNKENTFKKLSFTCPKCKHQNSPQWPSLALAIACSSCKQYFGTGSWNDKMVTLPSEFNPAILPGMDVTLGSHVFKVAGSVTKRAIGQGLATWTEYFLFNPEKGLAFLSEYDGHWLYIVPLRNNPRGTDRSDDFNYADSHFRLFQKFGAEIVSAKGEFFFDVFDFTSTSYSSEFIAPPYILTNEIGKNHVDWFLGEYKNPEEIAAAVGKPESFLPEREGRGYVQPITSSFKTETLLKLCFSLLILVTLIQIFLSQSNLEKIVYQNTFFETDLQNDQKMLITKSFTLEGPSKNVVIEIKAPMTNTWFAGDFALINEASGTEYNFSKEIEFYSGYEGGESWAEGSRQGEAFISQIPGGTYHINIYPDFSADSKEFSMIVTRDVSEFTNMFIVLLMLALFPAFFFIRRIYLERRRWKDSDYSPYSNE